MSTPTAELPDISVLVIDDDDLVRAGFSAFLHGLGLRPIECPGIDALDGVPAEERARVCAVVTDFRFRQPPSGTDALVRVRRAFPAVPILVLTGDTSDEPRHAAALIDAQLHHKPVRVTPMIDALMAAYYTYAAKARG